MWLTGDSDTANALASNTTVAVVGNTDTVNGSTGDMVWIDSQSTTVNMDGGSVYAVTGSNVAINGSNDTITLGANVSIAITGNGNTIWAAAGDVFATSGVGNIIHGVGTTLITSQNILLTSAGFISSAAQTGHVAALNGLASVGATSSGNQQDASLLGAAVACVNGGANLLGLASLASIAASGHASVNGYLIGSATLAGCVKGLTGYLDKNIVDATPNNNPVNGGVRDSLFADNRTVVDSIPPGPTYV